MELLGRVSSGLGITVTYQRLLGWGCLTLAELFSEGLPSPKSPNFSEPLKYPLHFTEQYTFQNMIFYSPPSPFFGSAYFFPNPGLDLGKTPDPRLI